MSQNTRWKHRKSATGSMHFLCKLSWLSSKKTHLHRTLPVTLSLSGQKRSLLKMPVAYRRRTSTPSPRFALTYRCVSAFFQQWVPWRTHTTAGSLVNTHIIVSLWTSHSLSPRKAMSLPLPLIQKCYYKIMFWQEIDFQCTVELIHILIIIYHLKHTFYIRHELFCMGLEWRFIYYCKEILFSSFVSREELSKSESCRGENAIFRASLIISHY